MTTVAVELWVAGIAILTGEPNEDDPRIPWELIGVFNTKAAAVEACTSDVHFLFGPFLLNDRLPDETVAPESSWYPKIETESEGSVRVAHMVERLNAGKKTP